MYWANFLHIYQPPIQTKNILERVVNESYRRVLAELKRAPSAKLTLNIPACLTELLDQHGFDDVIRDIRELLERGQIELTGTAKYHPLLPRIPKAEVIRQIELDRETNRQYFGEHYNPKGFFPPEAAYNREVAEVVAGMGFEWILAEELSYNGQFGAVKYDRTYAVEGITVTRSEDREQKTEDRIENGKRKADNQSSVLRPLDPSSVLGTPSSNLKIFFRERDASFKILSGQLGTIKLFEDYLADRLDKNLYLLTAMDGETFGHHRPGMEKLLFEIYKSSKVPTVTISELQKLFPQTEAVKTVPSTWALMEKDIEKNAPFSRWDDPENEIHKLQWELTNLAIKAGSKKDSPARLLLDRSLHSDQYWWASAKPWWSIEMMERGANELEDTVLVSDASEEDKKKARELYYQIITLGFEWQRTGKVEEMARQEDEEVRERTDEGLPKLPTEEIDKMIGNIRKEMFEVVEKQEYERAAQLRDRIKELEEYAVASSEAVSPSEAPKERRGIAKGDKR